MLQPRDPSVPPASLRLAGNLAAARSFCDLERLRKEFLATADLKPEERQILENVFILRERDLIEFYCCNL